jgi:hypothetical protein
MVCIWTQSAEAVYKPLQVTSNRFSTFRETFLFEHAVTIVIVSFTELEEFLIVLRRVLAFFLAFFVKSGRHRRLGTREPIAGKP